MFLKGVTNEKFGGSNVPFLPSTAKSVGEIKKNIVPVLLPVVHY
jgi:hypothetical protein